MYKTILFDVDGVLLSEERYFDASALTIYELLSSSRFLGVSISYLPEYRDNFSDEQIHQIRWSVFVQDTVLNAMKSLGINANWDMVYLQFLVQFLKYAEAVSAGPEFSKFAAVESWTEKSLREFGGMLKGLDIQTDFSDFSKLFEACRTKQDLWLVLEQRYQLVFGTNPKIEAVLRSLWEVGQQTFQEWYLGKSYLPSQPGNKTGFVLNEVPVVNPKEVSKLFAECVRRGVRIGVATGRPEVETKVPFESYAWDEYFDEGCITTASDVLEAETSYPSYRPLSKPHPFCYLRSYMESPDTIAVLQEELPLEHTVGDTILIVGDSMADLLAAKSLGCDFAAVLTGLSGKAARPEFETAGATYIWSDVTDLWSLLKK
ncbi:HAD family hydrolase [Alicyclobacillus sp. SO9]|uniref:HAD family hydrolase n=1 Tax=Alicyclobacillus sp. SO9 TaxID=2665646 RepID=UPI0018E7E0B8|nr:HAD hydrolase-like protein [Alicyclobacillus sp. SO9]QQE80676.1 HAD family hydrolase [Alicyclobacillus sp. SO9]